MSSPTSMTTPIPGDPEQVRRLSTQLAAVETRAREIESRLRAIETGVGPQMWRGRAADGFTALLADTGPDVTRLATSYGAASQALATYATELAAAQDAARAAEAEATRATGDRDRAIADRDSAEADAVVHAAAADEARLRLDPVTAQDAEQRRADTLGRANAADAAVDEAEQALRAAQQKADQAAGQLSAAAARCIRELESVSSAGVDIRNLAQVSATPGSPAPIPPSYGEVGDAADAVGKNVREDLQQKWPLHVADFVANGVIAGLAVKHASVLRKGAGRLMAESDDAVSRYLASSGGSAEARYQNNLALQKFLEADELKRRAELASRRVLGKIPIVGLGVTAAGIGYDISQGKPVVKATISGVGGALVAAGFGFAVGGPVGALGGLFFGMVTSGAIDWGYDQMPKGVKDAVEGGVKAVGGAVGNAWNALFQPSGQ